MGGKKDQQMEEIIAMTIDTGVRDPPTTIDVPIVAATAVVKMNGPMKFARADDTEACPRGKRFRGDDSGYRMRRII